MTSSSPVSVVGSMTALVEAQVADHRVEVGVQRERAEVAERRQLAADVVGRGAEHQAQERVAAGAR